MTPARGAATLVTRQFPLVAHGTHQSLRNKRQEWEEYRSEVPPFELRKSLPVL